VFIGGTGLAQAAVGLGQSGVGTSFLVLATRFHRDAQSGVMVGTGVGG
jgi:hypothetical protein